MRTRRLLCFGISDIGGGTTEIAVISLGGIVRSASIHVAGNEITGDIIDYMAQQHNIHIGRTTAEQIKFAVGSVLTDLGEEGPEPIQVTGRNLITGLPLEATILYSEVAACIEKTIVKIEGEILRVLQNTPPELYSKIVRNGIWLSGGGSLLRGISRRFSEKVNIPFPCRRRPPEGGRPGHLPRPERRRPVSVFNEIRADGQGRNAATRCSLSRPGCRMENGLIS